MKTHQDLQALISNYFMRTALIPVAVIGIALLILYFAFNQYASKKNMSTLKQEIEHYSQEVLIDESEQIRERLDSVMSVAKILQDEHELLFSNPDAFGLPAERPTFSVAENGVFYKSDSVGSSLYYSSTAKITRLQRKRAIASEAMDSTFTSTVEHHPHIVAAYFNSRDGMNRHYPFIDKVYERYKNDLPMQEHDLYSLADQVHNPERNPVWTGAYLDPITDAWMVSCLVPVYEEDFLEGVTGLDVPIASVVDDLLNRKHHWDAMLFILDERGVVIAMSEAIEGSPKLEGLKDYVYTEATKSISQSVQEDDLLEEEHAFVHESNASWKRDLEIVELISDGEPYLMMQQSVRGSDWKVMAFVEKKKVFKTIYKLKDRAKTVGYSAVAFILFFYFVFFYYLSISSRKIAVQIATPIKRLSEKTATIGTTRMDNELMQSDIEEIDELNQNFVKMVDELHSRTKVSIADEIESQMQAKEVKLYHEKSLIDPLTGLYNRYKVDEVIIDEIARAKRYEHALSVISLDIDLFKSVNDMHGHIAGDTILVDFAWILKSNARTTDIVARMGGEEFVVISSNTGLEAATVLAVKLRRLIDNRRFPINHHITASFGVTTYRKNDTPTDLFERADKALAQAKDEGRNQVISLP